MVQVCSRSYIPVCVADFVVVLSDSLHDNLQLTWCDLYLLCALAVQGMECSHTGYGACYRFEEGKPVDEVFSSSLLQDTSIGSLKDPNMRQQYLLTAKQDSRDMLEVTAEDHQTCSCSHMVFLKSDFDLSASPLLTVANNYQPCTSAAWGN